MPMFKAANEELVISLPIQVENLNNNNEGEDVVFYEEMPNDEQVVEMHTPEQEIEISFALPYLPGAPDEVVELTEEVETKDENPDTEEKDKSKAADQPKDLNWIKQYLDNIPKHKGETLGIERAKSYLNRGSNILSKMLQEDHDGKIDISKAEDARIEIENGIERLDKELSKRKKKANSNRTELKKEATRVGGVIVTVPLIVSSIARTCINSTISGGKDLEDTFKRLAEKFKLSDREKLEVIQLLSDMNYPMRRDFGFMVDDKEKYEYSGENNYNYVPNYQS